MSIAALIEAVEAGTFLMDVFDDGRTERIAYEAFGGSLDAAMALHEALLPGWYVADMSELPSQGSWISVVRQRQDIDGMRISMVGRATTPARAWLLAILRAKEAGQ